MPPPKPISQSSVQFGGLRFRVSRVWGVRVQGFEVRSLGFGVWGGWGLGVRGL